MKKRLTKALSILLTAVMLTTVFTIIPLPVQAAEMNQEKNGAVEEKGSYTNSQPKDAVEFNGHYYELFEDKVTVLEAIEICESVGGYLTSITSAEEQAFIANMAQNGSNEYYWIGATDVNDEGHWRWLNGEEWDYTNWHGGEPNNGLGRGEDYCVIYRYDSWRWIDAFGNYDNYSSNCGFICEWDRPTGHQVTVSLQNENNEEIAVGYDVIWYQNDSQIAVGKKLFISEGDYEYEIVLGEELSYIYKQPSKQRFIMNDEDKSVKFQLEKISSALVTGAICNADDQPLSNASVTFKQKYNGKYEKSVSLTTDEKGAFSSLVMNVPTRAIFSADGYYSFTMSMDIGETEQNSVDFGKVALTKLPENRITLNVTKENATLPKQEKTVVPVTSANGLSVKLFNQTKNKAVTDFTMRYPIVYIGDSDVSGKDVIKIEISDENHSFLPVQQTVQLDAQKTGTCSLKLKENGKFTVPTISGENRTTIMLFDSNGGFVSFANTDSDYTSAPLPAGNYKAVFIKKTDLLKSVSSISQLGDFGLTENTDYIVKEIPISVGVIADIGAVVVPPLDESKLYYTVAENTMFTAGNASPYAGQYVVLRCAYEVDDKYASSNETIHINLPDGVQFADGSLTVDGKSVAYTKNDSAIEIKTNERKGTVRFYVVATEKGQKDINALLSFKLGNSTVTQPVGTATFAALTGNINVPEKTGQSNVTVTGTTMAGSSVKVFDNGIEVGTAVANKAGNWSLPFDLVKPYSYSYHQIYAEITGKTITGAITTDTKMLFYDSRYIEVSKVTMINTAHPSYSLNTMEFCSEFDFLHEKAVIPSYNYWPLYPTFTFIVEFTGGDDTSLSNVNVITTDSSGEKTYVPCSYDKATGNWVGTHNYSKFSDVPVSVIAGFDAAYPEFTIGKDEFLERVRDGDFKYSTRKEVEILDAENNEYSIDGEKVTVASSSEYLSNFVPDDTFGTVEMESFKYWGKTITQDNKTVMTVIMPLDSAKEYVSVIENEEIENLISGKKDGFVKLDFELESEADKTMSSEVGCLPTDTWIDRHMDVPTADERSAERWGDIIKLRSRIEALCKCDPSDLSEQLYEKLNNLAQQYFDAIMVVEAANTILDLLEHVGGRIHNQNLERGSQAGQLVLEFMGNLFDLGFYSGMAAIAKQTSDGKKVTCPDEPDDEPEDQTPPKSVRPIEDPSGYVYEAVPSNRLEGVKAEVYYYDYATDEFGVQEDNKSDILWDAENYNQINPLYTDVNGVYAWDVPVGQWLVKFSKDGYQDTDSKLLSIADKDGYLPVPPPQTEVNVGMVSKAAPEVKEISFYDSEIRIEFSQYMKPETVNSNTVTVKAGGKTVTGTIEPVNEEYDYEQKNKYASVYVFKPSQKLSGNVSVSVNGSVNYANAQIAKAFTKNGTITVKPESINVKEALTVAYNSGALLELDVLPAEAGERLAIDVVSSSPSIAESANTNIVTDKSGHANIMVLGKLPGQSELTLSVRGTDISKTVKVTVDGVVPVNDRCEKVTADIASGSTVKSGTLLTLSTKTAGAEIYYTLDGTCPCSLDNPARIKYTAPIVLSEDTFIIAYAVKDNLKESYTAGFNYFVEKPPVLMGDVNSDGKVNALDRILLTRYINNKNLYADLVNAVNADVNADGVISAKDRAVLTKYVAKWKGFDYLPYKTE